MAEREVERRLAAILAADVVGYSRLMEADEEATLATLNVYRRFIDERIADHRGRVFGSAGDSVIAEFASPVEAVRCAVEIQQELETRNAELLEDRRMQFRIGINLGDVVAAGENLHGDGVNIAARLEELAEPGGVCVAGTAYDHLAGKLELVLDDLGEQELKNISRPVRVWRWLAGESVTAGLAKADEPPPLPDKPSIAVLPFDNMSGDPEQGYFADGITEDIITELSKFRWFLVIARNSTFTYKGKAVSLEAVGTELGARYVLESSVRKSGNRVRINAQLIDALNGTHIWAEKYDRDIVDTFQLQDEITREIQLAIVPEVARVERQRAVTLPADRLGAWELYQRAQWHLYKFSKKDNEIARDLLETAIEHDPTFVMASAALSIVHYTDVLSAYSTDFPTSVEGALKYADQAVALDDNDPAAQFASGRAYLLAKDFAKAEAALKRTLELSPSHAHAYHGLSVIYALLHHFEETIWAIDNAIAQSPRDPLLWAFENMRSYALHSMGRYEEAIEWADRASEKPTCGFWPHLNKAVALALLGRQAEAELSIREARAANPEISIGKVFQMHLERSSQSMLDGLRSAGLPE